MEKKNNIKDILYKENSNNTNDILDVHIQKWMYLFYTHIGVNKHCSYTVFHLNIYDTLLLYHTTDSAHKINNTKHSLYTAIIQHLNMLIYTTQSHHYTVLKKTKAFCLFHFFFPVIVIFFFPVVLEFGQ